MALYTCSAANAGRLPSFHPNVRALFSYPYTPILPRENSVRVTCTRNAACPLARVFRSRWYTLVGAA